MFEGGNDEKYYVYWKDGDTIKKETYDTEEKARAAYALFHA